MAEHPSVVNSYAQDLAAKYGDTLRIGKPWAQDNGLLGSGTDERLEEGAFLDPSLRVNTGVNARMVVIDKETDQGVAMFSRDAYNDFNPESFKTDEAHRAETNRLAERIRITSGYRFAITPISLPDDAVNGRGERGDDEGTGPASDFDLAERISGLFDKQIIWIRADGPFPMNGVVVPGGPLSKYVFIDVRADHPAHVVLGHELSHHMEAEAPAVYENLKHALSKLLRNHEEYRALYKIDASVTQDKLSKEMMGDLLGDSFSDPQFWNQVGKASPGLLRRIADVVMAWLNKLIAKVYQGL